MRISELASTAGVPLSAVKYYQREGLLPQGEKFAPNQASYHQGHVQRVRLIRALLGTGGLSIAAAKSVITALDTAPLAEVFGVAQHAMSMPRANEDEASPRSRDRVLALVKAQGWRVTEDNPGLEAAARALDGLSAIGFDAPDDYLVAYATAAATTAAADLRALASRPTAEEQAELMVVGTVLGDPLFAGFRRLAHQDETQDQFPDQPKAGQ